MYCATDVPNALKIYFERPDTPAKNSPVGALMVRVLAKNPGMNFDEARLEAHVLLDRAAGRRRYTIPPVLSPQEKERERERLRIAFGSAETSGEQARLRAAFGGASRGVSRLRGRKNSNGIGKLVSAPVSSVDPAFGGEGAGVGRVQR